MVVVNDGWGKNLAVPMTETFACLTSNNKMTSRGVLTCRFNSHPFQERSLILDQPVKIGRSVARAKPAANNAIFDCKVLSRNHALLWYDAGKFYLQDTKSSNGTFVNNHRLSKGGEESTPREVCSGDIVQFGVDVMENAGKVTHGCIIATLRLYLPDGKEAKASPSTVHSQETVGLEELYALNSYLQEALQRENQLEKKLHSLQRLLDDLRKSCDLGWKALIDEDRLLSRVEILECQLQTYAKNATEDILREELRKLQEDKINYQGTAKQGLQKVLEEKLEAVQKLQDLENSKASVEMQCNGLKQLLARSQQDLKELAQKYSQQSVKLNSTEEQHQEVLQALEEEKKQLQSQLEEQIKAERALQTKLEGLQADGDLTQQQLEAVQAHLAGLESGVTMDLIIQRISDTLKVELKERLDNAELISEEDQISKKDLDNAGNNTNSIHRLKATIAMQNEMLASMREKEREYEKQNEQLDAELRKVQAVMERLKDNADDTHPQVNNRESDDTEVMKKLQWEAQQNEKQLRNGVDCVVQLEAQLSKLQQDEKYVRNGSENVAQLEGQLAKLQQDQKLNQPLLEERNEQCKRLTSKVEELEEELVVLRERFSQCNLERTRIFQDLRTLQASSGQITSAKLMMPGLVLMLAIFLFMWLQF
ncbi:sarcolemmal membrane-associated protein [Frankliniella occidentalis]|uniref:Sarcolemmal membrane-associated protein n=1 Tax=Frankliniella occidentalis TaxID=133901 RepID=A0A6J1T0N8_FRAOC|nr:sarcolemmal membrane-associated protein [Frankliniella occidentalis]